MRKLSGDTGGSVVPLALYVLTIFGCGALYTLFFLEVGIPLFDSYTVASDAKTYIMMVVYATPLIVMVITMLALLISGLKREGFYYRGG